MFVIKLFVFIILVVVISCNKYCRLCSNHTLCLYNISGPGEKCAGFKGGLTDYDVKELVDRINERRNFVSLGHSKYLPQAANMKKVVWSKELATIAQRWADQCDPAVRPDRHDECRDLETEEVGQNIATVTGSTNGVNVKNFVDIWYMESLEYAGSVTYYNGSRDVKYNYLTQLIWAKTELVGCGRQRFYIKRYNHHQLVDRLVCNFSPKGNIHGRPVYIIGYPATQCEDEYVPDSSYHGLCSKLDTVEGNTATSKSLMRILNSVTKEIDPVKNQLKQPGIQGRKNIRRLNNSYVLKRDNHNVRWSAPNSSKRPEDYFQNTEKGHSRLYQGHDTDDFDFLHPEQTHFRRYDFTTPINTLRDVVYKRNRNRECTRKTGKNISNDCMSSSCSTSSLNQPNHCTRGQKNNCDSPGQNCGVSTTHFCDTPENSCQCTIKVPCRLNAAPCLQNNNCECIKSGIDLNMCQMRRNLDNINWNTQLSITRNDKKIDYESNIKESMSDYNTGLHRDTHLFGSEKFWNSNNDEPTKIGLHKLKRISEFSDRKRRQSEETFKPFWQEDDISSRQRQLKSMRYTTLSNKKSRKKKPMKTFTTQKILKVTESITIPTNLSYQKQPTEKFLSFDELLHLRKLTTEVNARRADAVSEAKTEETTEPSTTEYTANTPFKRLKHCTRKLTCTWTAASLSNEGNADINNRGSKTPPGYVEGCTRTSTCTRDFMNRNKMDTLPTVSTESEFDDANDEDYCEKRSLDVSGDSKISEREVIFKQKSQENYHEDLGDENKKETDSDFENCECGDDDFLRIKRTSNDQKENKNQNRYVMKRDIDTYNTLSYGDLFYLVLRKIMNQWKQNNTGSGKCLCNFVNAKHNNYYFLIIIQIFNLFM